MKLAGAGRRSRSVPPLLESMVAFGSQPGDAGDLHGLESVTAGAFWPAWIPNTTFAALNFTSGRPLAGPTLFFLEGVPIDAEPPDSDRWGRV